MGRIICYGLILMEKAQFGKNFIERRTGRMKKITNVFSVLFAMVLVCSVTALAQDYVTDWGGTAGYATWPITNTASTSDGSAGMGDGSATTGWSSIRGAFPSTLTATTRQAVVVTGRMEFTGGGGGDAYTPFRYSLTYQDSVALQYQYTDSAAWVATANVAANANHDGYLFCPMSGLGTMSNTWRTGAQGTVWTVPAGGWVSTNNLGATALAAVKQAPRNAEMIAGLYDFAISVEPLADGTNEVRWYMVEVENKYWFGGTRIDVAPVSDKFNGIVFGVNSDNSATQFNVYEVQVDMGDPIEVPIAPWEAYYVDQWGFLGNKTGGWSLIPDIAGDVTISGTSAPTDWAAVSGNFGDVVTPSTDKALLISGELELTDGGFEDLASLRFGVFYSDSIGGLDSTEVGYAWNGTDDHQSGYLFVPPSGSNVAIWGSTFGTVGTIVDDQWFNIDGSSNSVLGNVVQYPVNSIGAAGTYTFEISISPQEDGSCVINYNFFKIDGSYGFANSVTDVTPPTDKFNNISFAINNSTTTSLYLAAVQVDKGDQVTVDIDSKSTIAPTVYALKQNYPNPFNPTTMIEFDLPKQSDVSLVVFDLMGHVVAKLASGTMNPGYYKYQFDASNLASGVYLCSLRTGDFTSVKKLMLLK